MYPERQEQKHCRNHTQTEKVTVHSVHSNIRKSIYNSLREWNLLTPESLSYVLCPKGLALRRPKRIALRRPEGLALRRPKGLALRRSNCKVLCEQ